MCSLPSSGRCLPGSLRSLRASPGCPSASKDFNTALRRVWSDLCCGSWSLLPQRPQGIGDIGAPTEPEHPPLLPALPHPLTTGRIGADLPEQAQLHGGCWQTLPSPNACLGFASPGMCVTRARGHFTRNPLVLSPRPGDARPSVSPHGDINLCWKVATTRGCGI